MNVIAVDLDGTLIRDGVPIDTMVKEVNKAFEDPDNFIVIYTARSYSIFLDTRMLLVASGIKHHALVMEKMRATTYIDDKARQP